jgi:hypothetical protein
MTALHDYSHALRFQNLGNSQGDLFRQPFLHLQPSTEHLRQPCEFAQPQHPPVWDVADMHLPDERHHVVFAQTEYLNILDDDEFVVVFVENCAVNEVSHILFVALGEIHQGLGVAFGSFPQPFALGIFADAFEDGTDSVGEFFETGLGLFGGLVEAFAGSERWRGVRKKFWV